MLKRIAVLVMMFALLVGALGPVMPARAAVPIRITLNGRTLSTEVAPEMRNGRTLVPFRAIFEALGAEVDYDEATDTVFGFKGAVFVILNPGRTTAWVNGKEVKLDVGPAMVNGRTMVPLRFVAEALGESVSYVEATNTVVITTTPDVSLPKQTAGTQYTTVYSGEFVSLNYLTTNNANDMIASANTIDSLVEYDNYGVLRPALAKYWKISPDGLKYTFTLRQGLKWVDHTGKEVAEVIAQDFVDSAKYLLTKTNASTHANQLYSVVKGAKDYYDGVTTDFSKVGVKALDRYVVEYTLSEPVPYFMSMLTYVCFYPVNGNFLAQQGARFGTDNKTVLYCGPYILKEYEPQNKRVFVKNDKYWDKDNVHITTLNYQYNKEASTLAPELFFRGEISYASIPTAVLEAYMADPSKKDQIRSGLPGTYNYWYAFQFDPKFEAEYEPENWKKAAYNLNFRKAIFHGFDRVAAMLTYDPYNPTGQIINTLTPPNFASAGGKDYTQFGALAKISATDSFNKALAVEYKNKAMAELRGVVNFPVKVKMPYRSDMSDWTDRAQVVEQQLENLLGKDFIDIIPVGYPATNFLGVVRRVYNFAFLETNWGPDYGDPQTYTDPQAPGDPYKYSPIELVDDGTYKKLYDAAVAEVVDLNKRFELFAKAEAYLIDMAYVIPYRASGGGYVASKVDPFSAPYAPFGSSGLRYKYQVVLSKSRNQEQHAAAQVKWNSDRAQALKKAGQ